MSKVSRRAGKSLEERLSALPGYSEAREQRREIIRLGQLLRSLRTDQVQLTQVAAAALIGMEQSELSRIENGYGERGPAYTTITHIIDTYTRYLREQQRPVTITLSLDVSTPERDSHYSLVANDNAMTNNS
jgi:predicted transcriptional regulator